MPPSRKAMAQAFTLLSKLGCTRPEGLKTDEQLAEVIDVWCAALADLSDVEVGAAAFAHTRSPKGRWWPAPGDLLTALRPPELDDADLAWGELKALARLHGLERWPAAVGKPATWDVFTREANNVKLWRALDQVGGWAALHAGPKNLLRAMATTMTGKPSHRIKALAMVKETVAEAIAAHGIDDPPRRPGERQTFTLSCDPARARAFTGGIAALGGWADVCRMEKDQEAGNRASFRAAYRTAKEGPPRSPAPLELDVTGDIARRLAAR
jgi:hypothetical protein